MCPSSHRWRDDRLGSALRAGYGPWREAEPSRRVWDRIAADLEPGESQHPGRVSFHRATMLSVVVLLGVALAGLGSGPGAGGAAGAPAVWVAEGGDPTAIERDLALRAAEGPWNPSPAQSTQRRGPARRVRVPREAFNRGAWIDSAPVSLGGAVSPLAQLEGQ